MNPEYLITESQAAEFLGISVKTAQGWRFKGEGPQFVKVGKKAIRYQIQDLLDWIEFQKRRSTSDPGPQAERLAGKVVNPWGGE